ncbi:cytochrome P450 [Dentipellis sp. KUC8613]|nr:cytochrome P450 [Dentipellis sp. KUC8613]
MRLMHIRHPPFLMSHRTLAHHLFDNVEHEDQRIVVGLIAIVTFFLVRYINSPYRKLPPGPLRLPILGSLLSLVGRSQLSVFAEWKRTYGDLIYLSVPGQRMLVINSHKIAMDLLERRSSKYSDRPVSVIAYDLLSACHMMVLKPHSAVRPHRRAAHEALKRETSHQYYPMQTTEAILLVAELIAMPTEWNAHFQRRAASLIMSMIYDHPPMAVEETSTSSVEQTHLITNRLLRGAKPGESLVDFMPWMMYIPRRFAKWRRDAEEHCKKDTKYFQSLINDVKDRMASGTIRSCFTTNLIENASRNGLSAEDNAWLAGTMYIAGSETSANMLSWFLLAMALHPEAQRRAQDELDNVVGRSRTPSFADFDQLPYIQAIVEEVLRWRSPGLFGIPHATSEDDWYDGMFIPKGTICLPNVWLMHKDPELYGPNPADFNPARYLDDAGRLKPGLVAEHLSYGFGRRVCVGQHVANNMLFINFAIMLWALKIERYRDADGELVPLDADAYVEEGIAAHPSTFNCIILPRFSEVSSLLENEKELRGI